MTQHIVAVSGGKDSVCLALALKEFEPREYRYVFTPTGNELPEFNRHIEYVESLLGQEIESLAASSLIECIEKRKTIPNYRMRFCTIDIKIKPMLKLFEEIKGDGVLYVGIRADEDTREGLVSSNVEVRHPFKEWEWGIDEVMAFNESKGVRIPERTDCALCFYQRIEQWYSLFLYHPEQYQEGIDIENKYGYTFRSPGRDTWPASLAELAEEFKRGRKIRKRKSTNKLNCAWCAR